MAGLSPAPGVPQTPTKAVNGGAVASVVTAICVWLAVYFTGNNDADWNSIFAAVGTGIAQFALTYFTVFGSKNKALGGGVDAIND